MSKSRSKPDAPTLTKSKAPATPGRPKVEINLEMLKEITIGAELGLTIKELARRISKIRKISERTLYRRFTEDEDVLAAYKGGRVGGKWRSSLALLSLVEAGDLQAIKYYESTRQGISEKRTLELQGSDTRPLQIEISPGQRRERIKELVAKLELEGNEPDEG